MSRCVAANMGGINTHTNRFFITLTDDQSGSILRIIAPQESSSDRHVSLALWVVITGNMIQLYQLPIFLFLAVSPYFLSTARTRAHIL